MRITASILLAVCLSAPAWAVVPVLSGDEAREAAQQLTEENDVPVPEPAAEARVQAEPAKTVQETRDFTDAELGPAPSEAKLKNMIEGLRGKDAPFDPVKVEALRKQVEQEIESSSPEKKAMLRKLQQQVNETVQRLVREREKLGAAKDEK